jgi:hypothetical protein
MTEEQIELRLEQIRLDIARKTQELLFEPRKVRIAFASMVASIFLAGGVIGGVLVNYAVRHEPTQIVVHLDAPLLGAPPR